jgi:hypothetical protein
MSFFGVCPNTKSTYIFKLRTCGTTFLPGTMVIPENAVAVGA